MTGFWYLEYSIQSTLPKTSLSLPISIYNRIVGVGGSWYLASGKHIDFIWRLVLVFGIGYLVLVLLVSGILYIHTRCDARLRVTGVWSLMSGFLNRHVRHTRYQISIQTYENLWNPWKLWKPMKAYENLWTPWKTMQDDVNLWKPMKTYENLWKPRKLMEIYGNLWKTYGNRRKPITFMKTNEHLWKHMTTYENLWKLMKTYEILRKTYENPACYMSGNSKNTLEKNGPAAAGKTSPSLLHVTEI